MLLGLTNTAGTIAGIYGIEIAAWMIREGWGWSGVFRTLGSMWIAGCVVFCMFASVERTIVEGGRRAGGSAAAQQAQQQERRAAYSGGGCTVLSVLGIEMRW